VRRRFGKLEMAVCFALPFESHVPPLVFRKSSVNLRQAFPADLRQNAELPQLREKSSAVPRLAPMKD